MLDSAARRLLDRPLAVGAGRLDRYAWITPNRLTLVGLVLGLTAAVCAARTWWTAALVCWWLSRLADGLDGPLARHRARRHHQPPGGVGGFLDIIADFVVYGTTVAGVAVGSGGPPWPFVAVLVTYYVNGAAFLAFSSIAERTGRTIDDGRSLSFLPSLAEGTETLAVHAVWFALPAQAGAVAAGWAGVVAVSALQRVWLGYRILR